MIPEEKRFKYHNIVARNKLKEILDKILMLSDGKNLQISDCIKDQYGYYNDANFLELLDYILENYQKYSLVPYTIEERPELFISDREKDYIKTLMYVSIRALQANLNYVYLPDELFSDSARLFPMSGDDFGTLIDTAFKKTRSFIYGDNMPINENLVATAETLYHMLTDTYKPFPTPYVQEDIYEEFEDCEYDGPYIDPSDFEKEYELLIAQEMESIADDPESEAEYYANQGQPEIEEEIYSRIIIRNLSDPEQLKNYTKDKKRISLFFENPKEFIKMYDHLVEITSEEFAEHSIHNIISAGLNSYLENHNYTLYTHLDNYADALDKLFDAQNIIKNL